MALPEFNEGTMRYHDPDTKKMMSKEKAEAALGIAQTQQGIVGGALVGGAGAVGADGAIAQVPLLEQILIIQNDMLEAIKDVSKNLLDMLGFDEDEARRRKEALTEKNKEKGGEVGVGSEGIDDSMDDEGGAPKKKGWLGALLGGAVLLRLRKLLAPILLFFGRGGMLFRLFGKFGPLGVLILGFTLFYKYADEIAVALSPAVDKIKEIVKSLQPLIDLVMKIGDFLIKDFITTVGEAFEYLFGGIEKFIDGVKLLFDGDWKGGLTLMFQGILDFLMAIPRAVWNSLVRIFTAVWETVGPSFIKMVEGVKQLAVDALTAVTDWFIELKDKIVGWFVDAYNKVKNIMSNAVQASFDFIANIFNSMATFFSDSYDKTKTWITGLPDRILGFVKDMFSPIVDFFTRVGNKIKETINGIIDSLPMPKWLKNKMKFDIEPTGDEIDDTKKKFEPLEHDGPVGADVAHFVAKPDEFKFKGGILQNKDGENRKFAKLGSTKTTLAKLNLTGDDYEAVKGVDNKWYIVYKDVATAINPNKVTADPFEDAEAVKSVDAKDIEEIESVKGSIAPIINQSYSVKNAVASSTDVHSGALDVVVDPFHDKHAFSGYNLANYVGASSDIRLKEDIKLEGKSPSNINIYSFKYKGQEGKYKGVMAQEVPWASFEDDNGYLMVDYSKLDVDFVKI